MQSRAHLSRPHVFDCCCQSPTTPILQYTTVYFCVLLSCIENYQLSLTFFRFRWSCKVSTKIFTNCDGFQFVYSCIKPCKTVCYIWANKLHNSNWPWFKNPSNFIFIRPDNGNKYEMQYSQTNKRLKLKSKYPPGPFYQRGFIQIKAWRSNHTRCFMQDIITHSLSTFNIGLTKPPLTLALIKWLHPTVLHACNWLY